MEEGEVGVVRWLSLRSERNWSFLLDASPLQPTMNDQFLSLRKDNHLTTHFNLRKHRQK